MWTLRRRRGVVALVAVAITAVAIPAWSVLDDERRTARRLAQGLSARAGLSIAIDRARSDRSRVVLRGVHVAGGAAVPLDIRVGHLELTGAIVPLALRARDPGWITATATSAALPPAGRRHASASTVDVIRERLLSLLEWPAALRLRLAEGSLRTGGVTYGFDVRGEKTADGQIDLVLSLRGGGSSGVTPASEVVIRARATTQGGRVLDVTLDVTGDPARLTGLWPEGLPALPSITVRTQLTARPAGDVTAVGRLSVATTPSPAVIDFTSRYDPGAGRLSVSRYVLDWQPDIKLEGAAEIDPNGRITATGAGAVAGSHVTATLSTARAGGLVEGEVVLTPFDAGALATRMGLTRVPAGVRARTVRAHLSAIGAERARAELQAQAMTADALTGTVDMALNTTAKLAREGGRLSVAAVEDALLRITRNGHSLAEIRGASRARQLWPVALEGAVPDLSRVAPLLPWPASLSGSARIVGEVGAGGVLRGEGSLFVERASAFGLTVDSVAGVPRLADGRLLLPDLSYALYGGRGRGSLEMRLDGRAELFRARLEGEHVDLAEVVRAMGSDVARVTGRVSYFLTALYSAGAGFVAAGHVDSEADGGEISIDALQRLLDSPSVQVESSGLLRRTLENLREFPYASLQGDLRWSRGAGRVDLFLRGKKRFGIFPAPVEAINIRNMPLSVLTGTLARRTTP